jgi:hypothetical protein
VTKVEKVALGLLVTVGATAVDCDVVGEKKKQFEDKFGVVITREVIASVIVKIGDLLAGSETVVID